MSDNAMKEAIRESMKECMVGMQASLINAIGLSEVRTTDAIGLSENRTSESIRHSESNLHAEISLLRQEQTRISSDVQTLAGKHDELAVSTDQRLNVIEMAISSNPNNLLPALPPARSSSGRLASPYEAANDALARLPEGLRSNIARHFPNATRPPGTVEYSQPAASETSLLTTRRIGVSSEYSDCPAIPSSRLNIQEIESFLPLVRLSPVLTEDINQYLALNNNDLWPALSELAIDFLRHNAKVDENTLSLITVINAWMGSEPSLLTSLFVKFSSPTQARSLNSFKRNLPQGKRIDDVVPPCLMELENYLQE